MPYSRQPSNPAPVLSAADRKKKLLADGALHRANIMVARADISAGVHPGALAREALGQFSVTAKTLLLDTVRTTAMNPAKLSPLLMTGLSLLARKSMRKPLMYASIAGGAIAGAVYLSRLFRGGASASAQDQSNQNDDAEQ
ncbi:hypothetical protein D9O50_07905 [Oxalobacteraceae bacterium CAVE-383]|nr:hypothetical protein D9O50_07905 [Oxalobacteraceae bacterium CAVE-383]